jgi:hypothetical protein
LAIAVSIVSGWSVAPPAGLRGGGDERLVPQVAEADLIAGGERVRIGERDPAGSVSSTSAPARLDPLR